MCFAIPGKVVEVDGEKIVVDYEVEKRDAGSFFDVKVGDYVIVTNKIVIKIVPEEEAVKTIEAVKNYFVQNGS